MQFPLSLWDISLWLAITAIILLATSELASSYYGKTNLMINRKRLRATALLVGILFMLTVLLRILGIAITV